MTTTHQSVQKPFHELPLVLFTILGTAGAGVGTAHLLRFMLVGLPLALSWWEALLLSVFLAIGAMVSTGHLGKPLRAPLALKRVGRSPLSTEVLALGLALGAGVAGLLLPAFLLIPASWLGPLGLLASFGAFAFLLALGSIYDLPGQQSWRGSVAYQPLVMGTALGMLLGDGRVHSEAALPLALAFALLLVLDGLLALRRVGNFRRGQRIAAPVYASLAPLGVRLLWTRIILALILTPLCLFLGWAPLALGTLSLALALDRVAFYFMALKVTTESEVARVEAML